jgi:hypothetical protein
LLQVSDDTRLLDGGELLLCKRGGEWKEDSENSSREIHVAVSFVAVCLLLVAFYERNAM